MGIVPLSGQYIKPNLPKLCIYIYEVFYIFKRLNTYTNFGRPVKNA